MSSMRGADLEHMTALKSQFHTQSGTVEQLQAMISRTLESTWWEGPAAETFRGQWHGEFVPALTRLRDALNQNAAVVESRRAAIESNT